MEPQYQPPQEQFIRRQLGARCICTLQKPTYGLSTLWWDRGRDLNEPGHTHVGLVVRVGGGGPVPKAEMNVRGAILLLGLLLVTAWGAQQLL